MDSVKNDLYSRQIGAIGKKTMSKLLNLKVCLIGGGSVGQETVKCLSLLGIKELHMYDPTILSKKHNNYIYYRKKNGITLSENNIFFSKELNSNLDTFKISHFNLKYLTDKGIHALIITKQIFENKDYNLFFIEKFCNQNNIKLIIGINYGLYGYITSSFYKHTIIDSNGEVCESGYIENYHVSEEYIEFTVEKLNKNLISEWIKLCSGPDEYEIRIIESTLTSIKIAYSDTVKQFIDSHSNIRIVEFKKPYEVLFKSMDDKISSKSYQYISLESSFRDSKSDKLYDSLIEYITKQSANHILNEFKTKEFFLVGSIIAGIISHELIKITGKYTPINNDILIDISKINGTHKYTSNYSHRSAEFLDKELIKRIRKQTIFMIGAGALGCEIAKNLGMIDFCTGIKSGFYITDMDTVELSNLNRQFLFRNDSINKFKSDEIVKRMEEYAPKMKTFAYREAVGEQSNNIFNAVFWKNKSIIINALDNIEARRYVDSKCVENEKPLFESGTLGSKCNTQTIIPHKSATYSELSDVDDKTIPMCTIRSFPNKIEHCIEWGLEIFNTIITRPLEDIDMLINNNKRFINEMSNIENIYANKERLDLLEKYLNMFREKSLNSFIKLAEYLYDKYFVEPIMDLLYSFPDDLQDEHGNNYWSGKKLKPKVTCFRKNGKDFTKELYKIVSINIDLGEWSDKYLSTFVSEKKMYSCKKISVNEEKDKLSIECNVCVDDCIVQAKKISSKCMSNKISIKYVSYDKDDENLVDMMCALCNQRATIYNINPADKLDIKLISGRIIPALCTTTTVIAGFVILEILKYLVECKPSDININLGVNQYIMFDSYKPKTSYDNMFSNIYGMKVNTVPYKFNTWSFLKISCTKESCSDINDIIEILTDEHAINIEMMTIGNKIIYEKTTKENKSIFNIYRECDIQMCENLIVNLCCMNNEGKPIITPPLLITI